jgi:hypothetical protein
MILEIARPENSWELKQFFRSFTVGELLQFKIDRHDDFFLPYDIQSDQHVTYILRKKEDRSLQGVATFVIQNLWLGDRLQTVAIGRDLRINPNRGAIIGWGQHFSPVLEEIRKAYDVDYFFSTLNMGDAKVLNTFVRPRAIKRDWPRYHLFRRFNLVSLHGTWPGASNPLPHLRIRKVDPEFEEALIYYILQKKKDRDLSSTYDRASTEKWIERWQSLSIKDFYIALDSQDNIIGCVAPWSAAQVQEFIPYDYNSVAHNFRQFLKFGKWLGWTRALTKPVHRLKQEAPLNFRYLTGLLADNEDIFEALLWRVFNEIHPHEFLVYLQMRQDLHLRPPRGWVHARLPHAMYCLLPQEQALPDFLHPSHVGAAAWEPFYV